MKWNRVGTNGMQSGEYRVSKDFLDGCSLYTIYHEKELLKVCNDFEECKEVANEHRRRVLKTQRGSGEAKD